MPCELGPLHQTIKHHITMKTILALTALVGLAIAAPALQAHHGLETSTSIHPLDFNTEVSGPETSARSHLGLKNPVIVKNKHGYRLYRDSTEERADSDPSVPCSKQVRVKLCDETSAKSVDLRRSTKNANIVTPKDDVEESINMAKEAIESLQHDLKEIEHGTSGKTAQWKHGETDKDLHEDIESARLALTHAQKQFGTLESMNLRATTLRESETMNDKTEEEKLTKWKEAIEAIQRNVEIAKSIEDSLKAEEDHSSVLPSETLDTTNLMRSDSHAEHNAVLQKTSNKGPTSSMASSRHALVGGKDNKMIGLQSEQHMTTEKKIENNFEPDMTPAASELSTAKTEPFEHHHPKMTQGKMAEVSVNIQNQPSAAKTTNEEKMFEHDLSKKETSLRNTEHSQHNEETKQMQKSSGLENIEEKTTLHGKTITKERETNMADQKKSAWHETEQKDILMKSAEHALALNTKMDQTQEKKHGIISNLNAKATMKSAEDVPKYDDGTLNTKTGISLHTDMKAADNLNLASDIHLSEPFSLHLNHEAKVNVEEFPKAKSSELPQELDMEQRHAHEMHGHVHHIPQHHGHIGYPIQHQVSHVIPLEHGHVHGHMHGGHIHGHKLHHGVHDHGYHGKSVDMDLDSDMHPSMQMETLSEKSAMENMLQWKHHHDGARSYGGGLAYGGGSAYSSGGAGAVGVFPNARVGGCGIPLLLSCSPSVVSGSLTKSHGYAAPAYRTKEELNFKNKRDIFKAKEIPAEKVKNITKTTKTQHLEKKL